MEPKNTSQIQTRQTLRVLRPLFWWLLLVLILFAIRTHQRWMERTRLNFNVTFQGQLFDGANVTLDGQSVMGGEKISLGRHRFTVTHPKAAPFSTNLFVWYGGWNVGNIDLQRTTGKLSIQCTPRAKQVIVRGPEFSAVFANLVSTNLILPTDRYEITAQFAYSGERAGVTVYANLPASANFAPRLGSAHIQSSHPKTTFELNGKNSTVRLEGSLPVSISELPAGEYDLVAYRLGERKNQTVWIAAGQANDFHVEYTYGAVTIETEPAGATVFDGNGRQQGTTPLTLSELRIGNYQFTLERDGFESLTTTVHISADATNAFHTNLVNRAYASAMERAWQFMDSGNYDRAMDALVDALRAQPNDTSAMALRHQAIGLASISRAERLGQNADYAGAEKELEKALIELPDNARAKQLSAEFKRRQTDQQQREAEAQRRKAEELARQERERGEALTNTFEAFTARIIGATNVEAHAVSTPKPAKEVQSAISEQFRSVAPIFHLTHVGWTNDIFYIDADQEVAGGGRLCMIVGGPIKDGETKVMFKIVEFKSEAVGLKILGAVLSNMTKTTYQPGFHPLDPSDAHLSDADKNRIADGVRIVTERIQRAVEL